MFLQKHPCLKILIKNKKQVIHSKIYHTNEIIHTLKGNFLLPKFTTSSQRTRQPIIDVAGLDFSLTFPFIHTSLAPYCLLLWPLLDQTTTLRTTFPTYYPQSSSFLDVSHPSETTYKWISNLKKKLLHGHIVAAVTHALLEVDDCHVTQRKSRFTRSNMTNKEVVRQG